MHTNTVHAGTVHAGTVHAGTVRITRPGTAPVTSRRAPRRARLLGLLGAVVVLAALPITGGSAAADVPDRTRPAASGSGLVPGTPCSLGTTACVQLGNQGYNARSWFIRDGKVVRGPMSGTSGGPGKDTPTGTFTVLRKIENHFSSETTTADGRPSPMPYAVFFTSSGYAFHGGDNPGLRTAGCVRMANSDASYLFQNVASGDQVQIVGRSARVADGPKSRGDSKGDKGGGLLGGL